MKLVSFSLQLPFLSFLFSFCRDTPDPLTMAEHASLICLGVVMSTHSLPRRKSCSARTIFRSSSDSSSPPPPPPPAAPAPASTSASPTPPVPPSMHAPPGRPSAPPRLPAPSLDPALLP
eukprot:617734-Hanusia_phi.AAC.3